MKCELRVLAIALFSLHLNDKASISKLADGAWRGIWVLHSGGLKTLNCNCMVSNFGGD